MQNFIHNFPTMSEITCENFYTELPAIEAAIKESAFIGVDMEFSKIHENFSNPLTYFDSNEERYCKLRQKVSDITCIQLGLSIFSFDANTKTFKSSSYSFYTYPQTFYKSDSVVNFQTSCIEFLCKHKFDFNKLFHNRVPFLTDEQEITIKEEMLDELFFDKYFEFNFKFRSIEEELIKVLSIFSEWYDSAEYGDSTFLEINGCNEPVYIILMQYYLLKKCKNISILENQRGLNVTKIEEVENSNDVNLQIFESLKLSLLDKMMGIKYLLKLISKLKKPLVGHNCALDILILCNQFFKPLPVSFKDYQSFVCNNFGPIYDTKLLSKAVKPIIHKNAKWLGNSLSELYSFLKDGGGKDYSLNMLKVIDHDESQVMQFHQAGWDAYYTGYCFLKLIQKIKINSCETQSISPRYTLVELFKSVDFYKYKMFTCRSVSNIIDLRANDHYKQLNCLIVQNKGVFCKTLDLKKLKRDLKNNCVIEIKSVSNYAALIYTPLTSNYDCIISNLKSKYVVDNYSHYQSKKRKHYISLSLLVIGVSIMAVSCLKK